MTSKFSSSIRILGINLKILVISFAAILVALVTITEKGGILLNSIYNLLPDVLLRALPFDPNATKQKYFDIILNTNNVETQFVDQALGKPVNVRTYKFGSEKRDVRVYYSEFGHFIFFRSNSVLSGVLFHPTSYVRSLDQQFAFNSYLRNTNLGELRKRYPDTRIFLVTSKHFDVMIDDEFRGGGMLVVMEQKLYGSPDFALHYKIDPTAQCEFGFQGLAKERSIPKLDCRNWQAPAKLISIGRGYGIKGRNNWLNYTDREMYNESLFDVHYGILREASNADGDLDAKFSD